MESSLGNFDIKSKKIHSQKIMMNRTGNKSTESALKSKNWVKLDSFADQNKVHKYVINEKLSIPNEF